MNDKYGVSMFTIFSLALMLVFCENIFFYSFTIIICSLQHFEGGDFWSSMRTEVLQATVPGYNMCVMHSTTVNERAVSVYFIMLNMRHQNNILIRSGYI